MIPKLVYQRLNTETITEELSEYELANNLTTPAIFKDHAPKDAEFNYIVYRLEVTEDINTSFKDQIMLRVHTWCKKEGTSTF